MQKIVIWLLLIVNNLTIIWKTIVSLMFFGGKKALRTEMLTLALILPLQIKHTLELKLIHNTT